MMSRRSRPVPELHRFPLGQPIIALAGLLLSLTAVSAASTPTTDTQAATRPTLKFHRWQEDWSVLADPRLRTEPLDNLKYLPFDQGSSYLSLGMNLRERFEHNATPAFGFGGQHSDSYFLQRLQVHADLRLGGHVEVFTQLEDARSIGKAAAGPVDENRLDLRQAFLLVDGGLGNGNYKIRIGRQEMGFDLQRFVAVRDGPNVRQAFDALWLDWERDPWRLITFASQPVQYRSERWFDDFSNRHLRFGGFRLERKHVGAGELSAYYARYEHDDAHFIDASGDERRNIDDLRYAGNRDGIDWDIEAMRQSGDVGTARVRAWAIGARIGYTLDALPWQPRFGLQADAASGDRHPGDGHLGTFNPLFPNGYYFTLGGYTGYANLIHLKPSITLHPRSWWSAMLAAGLQWRQTVADAVYQQPDIPLAGTAGHGSRWTGSYAQLRLEAQLNRGLSVDMEAVHYWIGRTLRDAGGKDANYLETEVKFSW